MSEIRSGGGVGEGPPAPAKRSRFWRGLAWTAGSLLALLIVLVAGVSYYTTTEDFQGRVRAKVIAVLEDSTGGRVELGGIKFSLWHLAIEANGLVIHGTEGPGEAPYVSVERLLARVQIHTLLSHTVGKGAQSHVGLNYARVEQPHIHLIIDKDGKTNQPVPKHPSTSTTPVQNTLLDLQAGKVELADGLAVVNDRAIPFDLAAKDLNAEVRYLAAADHYGIGVDLADLRTKLDKQPEVQSKLHMEAEIGRDMAQLKSFSFSTGAEINVGATALVQHFAKPEWQAKVTGSIDMKQLGYLTGVNQLKAGTIALTVNGHNCVVTPQVAQAHPRFWQRRSKVAPSAKVLPPDPDCTAGYLLVGDVKVHDGEYQDVGVHARDVDASAQLHVTPTELLFTAVSAYLPGGGGSIKGELKIENWLGEVPANAPEKSPTTVAAATTANVGAKSVGAAAPVQSLKIAPVNHAHAYLTVTVEKIPIRTVMSITASPSYGDLGYDTAISGPVTVEWGGPVVNIADSVQVQASLSLAPTGVQSKRTLSNVPVTGALVAHYDGKTEVVSIQQLAFRSPESTLTAHGVLGVSTGDPLTNLQVDLQARDLGEFDQVLTTLGLESNGKKGAAAIPVVLHGSMEFNGTAKGPIADLDAKGHLVANDLALHFGSAADIHIDSAVMDGEYSPNEGVAVASSTVHRGTAVLNLTGSAKPRRVVGKHGVVSFVWDQDLAIDAGVKLASAQMTDLLEMAGQQGKAPVTGLVSLDVHAAGTMKNLAGGGHVTLTNGVAYGEAFETVSADATVNGQQVDASKVLLQAHGMTVTGSGGYNLTSKHIQAQLAGNNLQLSKFDTVHKAQPDADGVLTFSADANGTVEEPNLHAKIELAKVMVQGKALGQLNATASSAGSTVSYQVQSTLVGAEVAATGQTSLLGDYPTQAKLTLSGLDIANGIALFAPGSVKASSNIAGTVMVSGPAAKPQEMGGSAEFSTLDLKLQGIELKDAEPLRASLRGGVVTVDQLHITGQDTDLRAGGTVQVFGDPNAQGGKMNLTASGSVSMALAHTFDPDLITSGKVSFKMAAEGRVKKPSLTGDVTVENVNVAVDGVPNGLTNLHGTMAFNEDRLDVKDLVAMTGGGQLKIGGYLTYQKGVFADLTATGETVRVRLYGLSATANASFRLQGGPQAIRLSGNVMVTRFGVGPDVDFAAFAGAGGVQAPPDPNSATNKIQMDVHVTSAPQLDFQNSYAKLAGTVDLTVRGTLAVPNVLGRIQITEGSATYAGTNYQLQRGNIYFSNPVRIEPTIDLDATARVENYDLTIGVHGTPSNLKPTYRSEPPLSEADIFNLLALGRTREEAQLYQEQQVQAGTDPTTNALLGGALNATVSSRVSKIFGAGSIKIDPSFVGTLGNSAARITVQEPLSKQVTLIFATNVNQTAEQLIQVQYQLDSNNSIVATRDESGVFSIVYKIRKRYK